MANIIGANGQLPFFMSGPRLVLKVDGITSAFAIGLDINVSRNVQTIYQLGQNGPVANQAVLYNGVTGNIQIMKLVDKAARDAKATAAGGANSNGNGPAVPSSAISSPNVTSAGEFQQNADASNAVLNYTSNMQKQLDPVRVLLSSTFDIDVYQTYPDTADNKYFVKKHFTIKNCRLQTRNTNITAGQLVNESVGFVGTLLVSEDRLGPINGVADADLKDTSDNGAAEV